MKVRRTLKCSNCEHEEVVNIEEVPKEVVLDVALMLSQEAASATRAIEVLRLICDQNASPCRGYHVCDDTHIGSYFIKSIELVEN